MEMIGFNLPKDIVLDEDAFSTAATQFNELSEDMKVLKNSIETALSNLKNGFDTPAGRRFVLICESRLLESLNDQAIVIEHVSNNLTQARNMYQSVFIEYKNLNSSVGK